MISMILSILIGMGVIAFNLAIEGAILLVSITGISIGVIGVFKYLLFVLLFVFAMDARAKNTTIYTSKYMNVWASWGIGIMYCPHSRKSSGMRRHIQLNLIFIEIDIFFGREQIGDGSCVPWSMYGALVSLHTGLTTRLIIKGRRHRYLNILLTTRWKDREHVPILLYSRKKDKVC